MARIARIIIPDIPYHLTQRGNYRQTVFRSEDDREQYLLWIREYSKRYGVKIWAYCLMDNHVHFIVVPEGSESIARLFNQAHMRYSQYFNRKIGQRGHLWQGRFYSCPLDGVHLYTAIRYVERNPVRTGLVERAEDYPWSSALSHVKGITDSLLSNDLPLVKEIVDWKGYLSCNDDEIMITQIRRCSSTGRPAGDKNFGIRLEGLLGRILMAKPIGRPKKVQ
ncbi:transposase [bacterium]|nr:transposase [bacterium]